MAREIQSPGAPVEHRRACILVVDDEPLVRLALARVLAHRCEVSLADSANSALVVLASQAVDLVITDHDMPGRTGLELLAELRACHPNVVRVLCSGGNPPNLHAALDIGLVDVFVDKLGITDAIVDLVLRAMHVERDDS